MHLVGPFDHDILPAMAITSENISVSHIYELDIRPRISRLQRCWWQQPQIVVGGSPKRVQALNEQASGLVSMCMCAVRLSTAAPSHQTVHVYILPRACVVSKLMIATVPQEDPSILPRPLRPFQF